MSRYERKFTELKGKGEGAFVPFVVIGDPGLEDSLSIIQCLSQAGADALELGFPFSDPLADGPVIQDAMDRALKSGANTRDCLQVIRKFRETNSEIPIGLLLYANVVFAFGIQEFYDQCKRAGVDSVLVADVPVSESEPFRDAAIRAGIDPILLCPPNIDESTIRQIALKSSGYTYLLSRAGVTGTRVAPGKPMDELIGQLARYDAPPPLLGFGISRPKHVRTAINAGAKGVIVGSAIVQIIQENSGDLAKTTRLLDEFVKEMKAATLNP